MAAPLFTNTGPTAAKRCRLASGTDAARRIRHFASAALKIQRAVRRFLAVKNEHGRDPLTLGAVAVVGGFLLVDTPRVSWRFQPLPLAKNFLVSGIFTHPITRRELLRPEVRRLGAMIGGPLRGALLVAFDWRHCVADFRKNRDSLVDFLEADATCALRDFQSFCISEKMKEDLLPIEEVEELAPPSYVHFSLAHTYEHALSRLANARPSAVSQLIQQHCMVLSAGEDISLAAWRTVANAHRNAVELSTQLNAMSGRCGTTALGEWLFSWVRS
jgi:hypothetical protein